MLLWFMGPFIFQCFQMGLTCEDPVPVCRTSLRSCFLWPCSAQKIVFHGSSSHTMAFIFSPPFHKIFGALCGLYMTGIELSTIFYSQHLVQLWVFVFISIYFKEWYCCLRLKAAFVYKYKQLFRELFNVMSVQLSSQLRVLRLTIQAPPLHILDQDDRIQHLFCLVVQDLNPIKKLFVAPTTVVLLLYQCSQLA